MQSCAQGYRIRNLNIIVALAECTKLKRNKISLHDPPGHRLLTDNRLKNTEDSSQTTFQFTATLIFENGQVRINLRDEVL